MGNMMKGKSQVDPLKVIMLAVILLVVVIVVLVIFKNIFGQQTKGISDVVTGLNKNLSESNPFSMLFAPFLMEGLFRLPQRRAVRKNSKLF